MVSFDWCLKQKEGIKLVEPNPNLAQSYMRMSQEAIGTMNREIKHNLTFAISACYYSQYYALYAIMRRIGVKCEIHSCSIEFMQKFLPDKYSSEDVSLVKQAFKLRNLAQYYADQIISQDHYEPIMEKTADFVAKSQTILSSINETIVESIRKEVKHYENSHT